MGRTLPPFPEPQDMMASSDFRARLCVFPVLPPDSQRCSQQSPGPGPKPFSYIPRNFLTTRVSPTPAVAGHPHQAPREPGRPTFPFSFQLWLRRQFHIRDWHTLGRCYRPRSTRSGVKEPVGVSVLHLLAYTAREADICRYERNPLRQVI